MILTLLAPWTGYTPAPFVENFTMWALLATHTLTPFVVNFTIWALLATHTLAPFVENFSIWASSIGTHALAGPFFQDLTM